MVKGVLEMQGFARLVGRFARDARGTTAIEYGLIAVMIAIAAFASMTALGGGVGQSWSTTAALITGAMGGQ